MLYDEVVFNLSEDIVGLAVFVGLLEFRVWLEVCSDY